MELQKMAAEDIVRITYKELEEIAHLNEEKCMKPKTENAVRITHKKLEEIAHLNEEKEAKQKRDEERKKRPTVDIYQPPRILRHKQNEQQLLQASVLVSGNEIVKKPEETILHIQEEDWDEEMLQSSSSSKESSVENELEDIITKVQALKVTDAGTHTSDKVRRKKRPEIQRYVPKRRLLEQQNLESNSDVTGDRNDDRSSLSPKRSKSSSPVAVVSNAIQSPANVSPRKIDLKNDLKDMQVTVINDKLGGVDFRESPEKVIETVDDQVGYAKSKSQGQMGQSCSRGRGQRLNQNIHNSRQNESKVGRGSCANRRNSAEKEIFNNSDIKKKADTKQEVMCPVNKSNELKPDSDMYIVPSRPSTIGQEADRKDTVPVGMEENKSKISESLSAVSDRQSILERFKKLPSKSKSRSYDKLNNTDVWEEIDYFPDPQNLGTLVFERSRSSEQLNLSGKDLGKPVLKSHSSGLNGPKKVSGMRKRTDSLSSDISTATTGSDWSSDIDWDKDIDSKKIDWSEEVERELALQVQDETQKMNEWFERQEMGLSQKESLQNRNCNAQEHVMTSSSSGFGGGWLESKTERIPEKFSTLPFARKKHNEDHRSRQQNRTRGFSSRDSSVSSVQSIHSTYSNDSCRRRRRRRKNSNSGSQKAHSGSMENLNMNIKVTCGGQGNKREVQVDQYGKQVIGKVNRQGSYEQINRPMDRDNNWKGDGQCRGDDRRFDGRNYNKRDSKEQPNDSYQSKDSWSKDDRRPNRGRNWPDSGGRGGSSGRGGSGGNRRNEPNSRRDDGRMHNGAKDQFDRNKGGFHDNQQRREKHDYRKPERGTRDENDKLSRSQDVKQDEHDPREGDQEVSHPHGGGILHLPVESKLEDVVLTQSHSSQGQHQPYLRQADHHGDWGRGPEKAQPQYSRERQHSGSGNRQKSLYDPNNPTKPILIGEAKPILEFKDTDAYSPPTQSPYVVPSSPLDMYSRGYGQMYPQGYGYGYNMPAMPLTSTLMYPNYGYPVAPQDYMYGRDPDYISDFNQEQQTMASCSRSQCRMKAENLLREALPIDKQLHCLMGRRFDDDTMHMINQLRREVLVRLEQLILLDPDLSNRQNVEQILWKSVFHNIVELIRRQVADEPKDETKVLLDKYLDEGTTFYEALLDKLQKTFCFKLEQFLDTSILPPENLSRNIKLALLSAQRTMICLGDIARYKEQNHDGNKINYAKARSWYTKAQQIAPKNGRPYHQLAILALYTKRKLDAVYYYMRSLAASNPFLTARESLLSLFDEARKKAEAAEKTRFEERKKRNALRKTRNMKQHRIEIWMKNDGTSVKSKVDDNYDEDLSKLDASQLNKRFVLSFLNVHGKLFTKIGMEMFSDSCGQMLQEFKALFKDNAIGPQRLLQLMAINMFAIENTALKDESLGSTCRSLLQQYSVQMGLDMFGILVEKCTNLLVAHMKSNDSQSLIFSREMEELVPCVKIWTDWMICHADLWNPPPAIRDPSMGPEIDMWSCTANLCNILKDIATSHVKFYTDRKDSLEPVILSEDTMMSGFVPLLSSPLNNTFVEKTVDKDTARDCLRVEKLRVFGEYLCGIEPPMLAYSVENKKYYSVAPSQGYAGDEHNGNQDVENTMEEDDVVIEAVEEINHEDIGHLEHVQHLIAKKEELERKMEEKKKLQETRNRVLETNRHRAIEIEIHPSFLIPDTNCFIDYLPSMKKLIFEKQFTIVVPLVVINELDGLAQGKRTGHFNSEDHAHKVKSHAEATIKFLEGEFEKKVTHLKALTSKGTVMETISYRSEETDNSGNNDDLILNCCTHYCKDKARDYMPTDKDAPVRLHRDVVLLTDDRNLRLKAHVHNIPVKDVPAFMKWCSTT